MRLGDRQRFIQHRNDPVWGDGPCPCALMLIGERPGQQEVIEGRPFVGPAGRDMDVYLMNAGLDRSDIYVTNLVKTFAGYDKPTPDEIEEWWPFLLDEIDNVKPRTIGLLGTFAVEKVMSAWWTSAVLNVRHGIPWRLPLSNITVVPMYHPAFGLYEEARQHDLFWDFEQLAKAHSGLMKVEYIDTLPSDDLAGLAFKVADSEQALQAWKRAQQPGATNARRLAGKSKWGSPASKSDTRPEQDQDIPF
jgi:uracil-DNA glycosylase family 4